MNPPKECYTCSNTTNLIFDEEYEAWFCQDILCRAAADHDALCELKSGRPHKHGIYECGHSVEVVHQAAKLERKYLREEV